MKRLITQIFICLTLTVGQGSYSAVCAESDKMSAPNVVALAAPSTSAMATKKAVLEETRVIDEQFIPGIAIYASNFGGDEANRLAQDGVYIGENSFGNYLDLKGGNILLNPKGDMVVGTRVGKIVIDAGAIVFLVDSGQDVVIYDLMQTKPKQVCTIINKRKTFIEPGRMLVLTNQEMKDFEKLEIDCHRVSYRNAQPLVVADKSGTTKVFAADFSIAAAMTAIQPLKRLTMSRNREDKLAVERMLKAAVVLGDFAVSPGDSLAANSSVANVKDGSVQVASDPAP